jgi:hypothetical protein
MELEYAHFIIDREDHTKQLLISLLGKMTDGLMLNATEYRHAQESIREVIGELFYDECREAREVIRQHDISTGISLRREHSTHIGASA